MQPVVPAPAPTGVLQGTIIGLGALRPVVLQNNDDVAGARSFLNTFGQNSSVFSFDSVPVGSQYRITVKVQPFAKICTVANGSGIVGAPDAAPITVTCVNDPAVARYCVGGTISQSVHDAPAAQLMLTTEEGTRVRTTAGLPVGSPSCWFPDSVFDSLGNLPVFAYTVTATFTDASGNVNICAVTNGTNPVADSGPDAVPLPPSADVMDVAATACSFTVTAAVALNAGAPAQPLGDGLTLALREPRTGIDTQTVDVAAFETVSFPDVYSNADAIYELVVTHQPYGQTCVVGGRSQLQWGGAVLLLNPVDTANGWMIDRKVRCNPDPGPASQLTGTYRLTTVATEGTTSVTTATRNFLTFFDDGTFLYGLHAPGVSSGSTGGGASTASGVQHGFYAYDPAAGTLMLTPLTDTVTGINSTRLSSAGATRTLTEVVKSSGPSGQISARFSPTVDWILTEPRSVEGQMPGTWATADHRRVWIFDGSTYAGFHAGVNGLANAEDACFSIDPSTPQAGYFTRRGNATTCQLLDGPPSTTLMYTLEVPNLVTTPRAPEGFIGHWPQSGSNADGRPSSPVHFSIDPGTPDRLTVQDTSTDGTPRYPPIVLFRTRAN